MNDVVLWAEEQAERLRRVAAHDRQNEASPDWPNIIEEIESVGRSERAALTSHVRIVIEHLIKLEVSPAEAPRAGWRETVLRGRSEIEETLEASPSLRPDVDAVVARQLGKVRLLVAGLLASYGETPRVPLDRVHYGTDQVLGPWLPPEPADQSLP
jgi:Domain of unknown function DUF29